MKKRFLTIGLLVAVLVVAVLAVACGSGTPVSTTTTVPTGPIKVGHIVELTGKDVSGKVHEAALKYAFASVGNTVAGRSIEIVEADAGQSAISAVDAAQKLVEQDKVVAIFGPTQIGEKTAVASYCKKVGVPVLFYDPTPLGVFKDNKWVIGSGGTTEQCPSCMADYLYTHLGYRTIITMTVDSSAGRAFIDPLAQTFTALGGKVVAQYWDPEDATDFAPYFTTFPKADCLVAWQYASSAIALLTQWHQSGLSKTLPIMGAFHGAFLDSFVPMAMQPADAAAVVGAMAPMAFAPDVNDPKVTDMILSLNKVLGFPPADDSSSGPVQAATMFLAAVQKAGGNTAPEALIAALTSVTINGPEGPQSVSQGEQAATKNIYIVKVEPVKAVPNVYHYVTVFTYDNVPPEGFAVK